jgi:hypothetical protein
LHFAFESNRGADQLLFGMRRDETRKLMAQFELSTRAFLPNYDAYPEEGVKLGFDSQDLLAFIEVRSPSTASFRRIDFFAFEFPEILEDMTSLALSLVYTVGCYIYPEAGISLYAPNNQLLSVSLYKQGYYDDVLANVNK